MTRRRDHRRTARSGTVAAVVVALMGVSLLGAGVGTPPPAGAQTPDSTTTTSSPASTSTTDNPAVTVPSTPSSTTTTAPPPPPPADGQPTDDDEGAPVEVPTEQVVVPPADPATPPDPSIPILQQVAGASLADITRSLRQVATAQQAAAFQVQALTDTVSSLTGRLSQLRADKADAVTRLQQARLVLRKRAVASYVLSPTAPLNQVLGAADFNDLSRRAELLASVIKADHDHIDEYEAARDAVGVELDNTVSELDAAESSLAVAMAVQDGADASMLAKQVQLAAVKAGGSAVGAGFVFPVGGPHSFTDTFGAPRMFGTPYAHLHQGTDVFAQSGTPLLACERGVLIRIGSDLLGGTKVWLVGASGTYYYYAHLSAFGPGIAPGSSEGKVMQAGDVVGYVGNTGNAATTPAHLHFEVHPSGGPAVNPYPLLKIVDDAQARLTSKPSTTTTRPTA